MTSAALYVGIAVDKAEPEVAVRPSDDGWRVANDPAGVAALVVQVHALAPTLIVLEAGGGDERPLGAARAAAGKPAAVVNPRQARDFARATGNLAETDHLDARALAHF